MSSSSAGHTGTTTSPPCGVLPLQNHHPVSANRQGLGQHKRRPDGWHWPSDELMDLTPPPLAIIFRTHPDPHDAMGSTTAGLLCTSDDPRVGGCRLVSLAP
ncbi:Huntingtin [Manis pentadactyla]|nr:Huntingtin [Manis pentadactyla]